MFSIDTHEKLLPQCQHPISNNDKGGGKKEWNKPQKRRKEEILKGKLKGDHNENGERKCAKTKLLLIL